MTEMSVQIGLLGPFRVCVDGERVDVPPRRLRDLLATLALSAGQSVSVDRLATAVWGEDFAVDVRVNLQSNVRRLRRLLGADAIRTRDRGYQLDVEPDDVDALRFHRLLGEVAATYDREKLSNALNLWRGTPFAGTRSDWLEHDQPTRTPDDIEEVVLQLRTVEKWGPDRIAGYLATVGDGSIKVSLTQSWLQIRRRTGPAPSSCAAS